MQGKLEQQLQLQKKSLCLWEPEINVARESNNHLIITLHTHNATRLIKNPDKNLKIDRDFLF